MKIFKTVAVSSLLLLSSCGVKDVVNDAKSTVAIKDVEIKTDEISFVPKLPTLITGKTFAQMVEEDSAYYSTPSNYGVEIVYVMSADNSKDGAADATFNGAEIDINLDTATAAPLQIINDGFTVAAGATVKDSTTSVINAADDRISCRYIFEQTANDSAIGGNITGRALWKLGTQNGEIPLPVAPFEIQTNATPETQAFLSGAIEAGIFDEK